MLRPPRSGMCLTPSALSGSFAKNRSRWALHQDNVFSGGFNFDRHSKYIPMKPAPSLVIALIAFLGSLQILSAATIVNGSFENGSFSPDGNNSMSLSIGSTAITGWTVINAETQWTNTPNTWSTVASQGNFFLDLTGYHDSQPYGGVSQLVEETLIGQAYRLTFDLGTGVGFIGTVRVRASADASSQEFEYVPIGNDNQYGTFNFDFTATNTETLISFIGTYSSDGRFIAFDNVSISAIPEPSISVLLAGAGAVALSIRRRIRKG